VKTDMKKKATSALLFLVTFALFFAKVKWFPGFHGGR
jgi:hypothetical protein